LFRLVFILLFSFLNLYACKGGYNSCKRKIIDSDSIISQNLFIPVGYKKRLVFSTDISKLNKNIKILKKNLFLSLYLVQTKKNFKYPFRLNKHPYLGIASVDKDIAIEGRIKKHQIGINQLALFDEPLSAPSILLTSCCSLEGIVTPRGIIEKDYIERFLTSKDSGIYGDIGIRVKDKASKVIIYASNPFVKQNLFKVGDIVYKLNGKKITSASKLMKQILFAKISTKLHLIVKRKGKFIKIDAVVKKRVGGGYISDTFLEKFGIYLDANLYVVKIDSKVYHFGLKVGDKLLQVNMQTVKNKQDILKYIANFDEFASLLFERDDFQFFVTIN